jgi:hypothetical protein
MKNEESRAREPSFAKRVPKKVLARCDLAQARGSPKKRYGGHRAKLWRALGE